jgi:pyruvate/2-oxoglutarate dehydrogenase complex dihydrolipoamide acyltransferase (E2) component
MKEDIFLPKMGLTTTEGTLDKWLAKDGDIVKKGEGVVEVTTDKITTTIESPKDGILQILKEEGEVIKIGEPFGEVIDEED